MNLRSASVALLFALAATSAHGESSRLTIESTDGSCSITNVAHPSEFMVTGTQIVTYSFQKDLTEAKWHKVRQSETSLFDTQTATLYTDAATLIIVTINAGHDKNVRYEISNGKITTNLKDKKLQIEAMVDSAKLITTVDLSTKYVYIDLPQAKNVTLIKYKDYWAFRLSGVYPGSEIHHTFSEFTKEHEARMVLAWAKDMGGGLDTLFEGIDVKSKDGPEIEAALKSRGYKVIESP